MGLRLTYIAGFIAWTGLWFWLGMIAGAMGWEPL